MLQSFIGLISFVGIAWIISENRKDVNLKLIVAGLALQIGIAVLMLKVPFFSSIVVFLNGAVEIIQDATTQGTSLLFGYLGGDTLPFQSLPNSNTWVFAFRALPLILVVGALSSLLFHWGVIPLFVKGFAIILRKTMGISGAVGIGVAVNVFIGMIEAPLVVRPYLKNMSRSDLFTLMTSGMATIAGTVLVFYASLLSPILPGAVGHIIIASIISVPAAIVISQVIIPKSNNDREIEEIEIENKSTSSFDAIIKGTTDAVPVLINVMATILVFVTLVNIINQILELLPPIMGSPITLGSILGVIMWPFAWLMGIPATEAFSASSLLGTKIVLNELLAYIALTDMPEGTFSSRSIIIMTYALCGFANFGSLGILTGGLISIIPERKSEIISLGLKSLVSGTLATCMTGAVVGILYF